jgi:hypothetical protein
MRELESLRKQLAREDELLSATAGRIDSARQKIETLERQIDTAKREIEATERLIEKLHGNSETIKKRRGLLLQYIELAKAGDDTVPPRSKHDSSDPPAPETATVTQEQEDTVAITNHSSPDEDVMVGGDLPFLEDAEPDLDELEDLTFVEPPEGEADLDDDSETGTASFDDIDEISFTHEILPHTQTFAEELLLVLAYHRKATAPKNVVRIFRRLDYAPKQPATEENVTALVELNPHQYQYAAGGRIALTREGRDEALRLLGELT